MDAGDAGDLATYRFTHLMLASGLTASFLVAGLSAWRLLQEAADAVALRTLRIAVVAAATPSRT